MKLDQPLTAKALEAYRLCPMKYRLYRLGGPATAAARRVDAARALHAAIRQSLNQCYRMGGPQRVPVESLIEAFTDSFDGSASADSREEEEYRSTGVRLLTEYHEDHRGDPPAQVAVDVRLAAAIGGSPFEARADRRQYSADRPAAFVVYTTARRPASENALQADLQTAILQMLAQQAEGREVVVELHALRKRRSLDATKPPDVLDDLRQRVTALAAAVAEATDYPTVRARHCRWCHARGVCPEWARE